MSAPARTERGATLTHAQYQRFQPIVRRIAMRMARKLPTTIGVDDLVGFGWVGLMEAYRRAPTMPVDEFEAYAVHRVRGAMLDHLRSADPATRRLRALSRRVAAAISELSIALGRAPEEEEIAAHLGLTHAQYTEALSSLAGAGMARLELLDFDQMDSLQSEAERPDDVAGRHGIAETLVVAIGGLPPRLAQLLALYYQEECTLRDRRDLRRVGVPRVAVAHRDDAQTPGVARSGVMCRPSLR